MSLCTEQISINMATSAISLPEIQSSKTTLCVNHNAFIVYVRTKQFLKTRLKGIDENEAVHISQAEIAERFFPFPKWDCKNELQCLVEIGQLRITETIKTKSGHNMFLYEALLPGKVDLYLIKPKATYFDPDILQMIEYLKRATVDQDADELPPYFESFINFRDDCMNLFFTVDDFSGRVHSPVTSLKGIIREHLLIDSQPTIGLDVATMQPLLLGKVLKQAIGPNEYTSWIESGEDIYIKLQQKANLETRDQCKKRFFEILFAPADDKLAAIFGDAVWITWINMYKSQLEPRNPHNAFKPYSNIAWLLQSTEVSVMRKVWHGLINAGIPFLSVHDEVIVKLLDQHKAEMIFRSVLDHEFTFYKLNLKCRSESPVKFIPPSSPPNTKRDYIGPDGLVHMHLPDMPEL